MTAAELEQAFEGAPPELAPAKIVLAAAIAISEDTRTIVAALVGAIGAIAVAAAAHPQTVAILASAIAGLQTAARISLGAPAAAPPPPGGLPS